VRVSRWGTCRPDLSAGDEDQVLESARFQPPAPVPRGDPPGPLGLLRALWNNPLEAWSEAHFREPVVTAGLGLGQVAVVSCPDAIRRVLVDHRANYRKDTLQRRVMSALGSGLLTAEGEQWHVQRRTLAPIFTRKAVLSFSPAMAAAAEELVERWRVRDGKLVDVAADVTRLTLEVLERTIFSDGLGRDTEEVRAAMRIYFDSIGRIDPLDILGVPDFVPRIGQFGARRALALFRTAVDAIIATRRRRLAEGSATPRDILSLLIEAKDPETGRSLSEDGIRSNIITLIVAGHETTASAVIWSLVLLAQSPQWRRRVAAEIDREAHGPAEDIPDRLVETRAVLEEALRLYPPLPAISRVALEADVLSGVRIKKGSLIVIAPYVVQRHRRLWDDPDAFDPSRFLPEARDTIDPFAYLPFGRGPRGCIGVTFAMQEAALIMRAIVKKLDLDLRPDEPVWPVHRITLQPRNGLLMWVNDRSGRTRRPAWPSPALHARAS
jgi:cytochrome P450